MLIKAKEIASQGLKEMLRLGNPQSLPQLDTYWLHRWKRDYHVVLRRPNAKWKVSYPVLVTRLRAMFRNLYIVRWLATYLLGHDLSTSICGIDEKPLHFNESGSKMQSILEVEGTGGVRLRRNHAQSRERLTVMTYVTSNPVQASAPEMLPIEFLVKGKTTRSLQKVVAPNDMRVSVTFGEKGSYRNEHILEYLNRWLEPWTPKRASAKDYRILFMDVASSHLTESVLEKAWSRGYIVLFHYGDTTGLAQVNDTENHAEFSRLFQELESIHLASKGELNPADIGRAKQDVVTDGCKAWRMMDHLRVCRGHKSVGLSNCLHGTEDDELGRDMGAIWQEFGREVREEAKEVVASAVAKGITFDGWRSLIRHPAAPGAYEHEGQEFEGALEEGEQPWLTEADALVQAEDDAALVDKASSSASAPASAPAAPPGDAAASALVPAVEVHADDTPAAVAEGVMQASTLLRLEELRKEMAALSKNANVKRAMMAVEQEALKIKRASRGSKQAEDGVLRRHVRLLAAKEASALAEHRKEVRAAAKKKAQADALKAKNAHKDAMGTAEKKAAAAALAKLPQKFTAADLGQNLKNGGTNTHVKARVRALEILRIRSPALPDDLRADWPRLSKAWAQQIGEKKGTGVGKHLTIVVGDVKKALGSFYNSGNSDAPSGGDRNAFKTFVLRMEAECPAPASALIL